MYLRRFSIWMFELEISTTQERRTNFDSDGLSMGPVRSAPPFFAAPSRTRRHPSSRRHPRRNPSPSPASRSPPTGACPRTRLRLPTGGPFASPCRNRWTLRPDRPRGAPRVAPPDPGLPLFFFPLPCPEDDDPNVLRRQPFPDLLDQVETLLGGEAPDDPDDGLGHGASPPELGQEVVAAYLLPRQILSGVPGGDQGVRLRVPVVVVHAVQVSAQAGPPLVQYAFEPVAVFGRLDLPAVRVAYRGEDVGKHQPCLQHIELAVELDPLGGEQLPAEPREREVVVPEQPLVPEVVDGEDGPGGPGPRP